MQPQPKTFMKKLLFLFTLLCVEKALQAQTRPYIYTIKADSVLITNSCDTAELIIENHTQNVPGFLFNKGRGRTEFRRARMLSDSTIMLGGDTLIVRGTGRNFANADLTLTGDRYHNGAFRNLNMSNFSSMNLKSNAQSGNALSEIAMDPYNGFRLSVHDENLVTPGDMTIANGAIHYFATDGTYDQYNPNYIDFLVSPAGFSLFSVDNQKGVNGQVSYYDDGETGSRLQIGAKGSIVDIGSVARVGDSTVSTQFYRGDSIVTAGKLGLIFTSIYKQTHNQFIFKNAHAVNDFRIIGLPASSSTTDSVLVADNNGQVKKRPQIASRKSATVTGSSYSVPSDIDVVFVNYTGGQATITLPTGTLDREITIKNLNTTNSVILSGLDTSESNAISTRGAITVKYTGSAWVGISKY
jgi:hypothetical protein